MRQYLIRRFYIFVLFSAVSLGFSLNPVTAVQKVASDIYEADITEEMEVLDTGPIHEGFAETSTSHTESGIVV
ncbi:MAG: hypothetical protein JRG81_17685, partial [Deltaproteobacteria bacterium]|nr:hypothetical protein [Deltaproteobacteria bacterium]